MKKGWKILGAIAGAAALAALTPYSCKKDKETGSLSVKALLWNLTTTPDADGGSNISINILPGQDGAALSFTEEDDPLVECTPVCECTCSHPAEEPVDAPAEPEAAPSEAE